jgi:hypothetical protein
MSAARDITDITPKEKFVLMALADYASDHGVAWPRLKTLQAWTCLGRSTVLEALAKLEGRGLIKRVEMVRKDGGRTSSNYLLAFMEPDSDHADRYVATPSHPATPPVQNLDPPRPESGPHELSVERSEELKPSSSSKKVDVQSLVDVWNAHCGSLPSVKTVGSARRSKLVAFINAAGGLEEAWTTLRKATWVVAQDDFWLKGKYGLDNLLAGGKVFQRAEQYDAHHAEPEALKAAVGDHVEFRYRTGSMERWAPGVIREITDTQFVVRHEGQQREFRVPHRDVRRP